MCALTACTSTQLLTQAEARALGTRTWDAATDEVFDATWLTLTARGFTVSQSDRIAGTLVITKGARTWDVDVAALGAEQRVVVSPREQSTRAELSGLLDALEAGTRPLLRAWHDLPEWKYDGRRNLLSLPTLSVVPPLEWEWLDYDISRRLVTVQRQRARTGLNPTLLVEVDRRRPDSRLAATLQRAAGLALGARQRLVLPDELEHSEDESGLHGRMRVLDGTTPREVVWHAHQSALGTSDVRLVMVCPVKDELSCEGLWEKVAASVTRRAP
ncbi:MAG: hypothetical protein Q8L48_10600 [Archangium sp.]|nr:hypothetical protein [Archangium sp.]